MGTDDHDPRPPRRPGTHVGDRGDVRRPVPPRQDDASSALAVPLEFSGHEPNTGVHNLPELELLARAKRTQHVTEGVAAVTLSLGSRLGAVEGDLGAVKASVATVQASLDAQDKYLRPLVDLVVSKTTVEHTKTKATIEIDAAKQLEQVDIRTTWREVVKTVLAIVGPAAALVLGAIHLRGC